MLLLYTSYIALDTYYVIFNYILDKTNDNGIALNVSFFSYI